MRTFKDNTTYNNPAMWFDSKNQLWKGPVAPDSTMHFARFCGFMDDAPEAIWVLESSECPEDCVMIVTTRCGTNEGLSQALNSIRDSAELATDPRINKYVKGDKI
jgi:hypothetical protein